MDNGIPERVTLGGEEYRLVLDAARIEARIAEMGAQLSQAYAGKRPVVIGVLNGAVVFLADLMRRLDLECELDFVKLSSYGDGKVPGGTVREQLSPTVSLRGRHVLVVEDIVDSGRSLGFLLQRLEVQAPASLRVVALLQKGEAFLPEVTADFVGFPAPDGFVIGYGLDCAGLGRNLPGIYALCKGETGRTSLNDSPEATKGTK